MQHLLTHPKNTLFVGYRGSIAHGTYIPKEDNFGIDDKDILSIFVGDKHHYLGFTKRDCYEHMIEEHGVLYDIVEYELRKLFGILLKQNPNVLYALWLPGRFVIQSSDEWRTILHHRDLFVSKEAYHSFTGYAYGQLHRMTHLQCKGYMGQKRKQLVEQFGYDCKNASHLIRLLRMGIEFLVDGELRVVREDATQLIEIKRGEWSLERVQAEADVLFKQAQEVYIHSTLPVKPDYAKAEALLISIVESIIFS